MVLTQTGPNEAVGVGRASSFSVKADEIPGPVPDGIESTIAIENIDVPVGGRTGSIRRGYGELECIVAKIEGTQIPAPMKNRPTPVAICNTIRFVGHSGSSEVVSSSNVVGSC